MRVIQVPSRAEEMQSVIDTAVAVLRAGGTAVYPTDTSYGLAALATNRIAIEKIYKIKGRGSSQPIHIVVPSLHYAKQLVTWNPLAEILAKEFLPGPLSLVLPLCLPAANYLEMLASGTGFLGIRFPKNNFVLKLALALGEGFTATSAGRSKTFGGFDAYSAKDVIVQFSGQKDKPDLVLDAGQLPRVPPSTFVKIQGSHCEILREGSISRQQIEKAVATEGASGKF